MIGRSASEMYSEFWQMYGGELEDFPPYVRRVIQTAFLAGVMDYMMEYEAFVLSDDVDGFLVWRKHIMEEVLLLLSGRIHNNGR